MIFSYRFSMHDIHSIGSLLLLCPIHFALSVTFATRQKAMSSPVQVHLIQLYAQHYLPRLFNKHWDANTLHYNGWPAYICVDESAAVFCLCGKVLDCTLCAEDGAPVPDVFVNVEPVHPGDGAAIVRLVKEAGFPERGENP